MAERQARDELRKNGYEVVELKEGQSTAGLDALAVKRNDLGDIIEIKVVEVKSTTQAGIPDVNLSSNRQSAGGVSHLNTMLDDVKRNLDTGKYPDDIIDLYEDITAAKGRNVRVDAELWHYRVDPFANQINQRATTDWTARSKVTSDDFDIDTGFKPTAGRFQESMMEVLRRFPKFLDDNPTLANPTD